MSISSSADDMEWTPTRNTVVLHQSTPPSTLPFKRKIDHISGGIDAFGRLQQPYPVYVGAETEAHAQPRPWQHPLLFIQQCFLAVVLCAAQKADEVYAGAKRRWFVPTTIHATPSAGSPRSSSFRKKRRSTPRRKNVPRSPFHIPGTFPASQMPSTMLTPPTKPRSLPGSPTPVAPLPTVLPPEQPPINPEFVAENGQSDRKPVSNNRSMRVLSELDAIELAFGSPENLASPPQRELPVPERPVLEPRSINIVTSPAFQTPVKVRKSVAFAASPRTGRPVTHTKRFYVGETIDHPSPSSTESSYLQETPSLNAPPTPSPFNAYDPALLSNGFNSMSGSSSETEEGSNFVPTSSVASPDHTSTPHDISQDRSDTVGPHTPERANSALEPSLLAESSKAQALTSESQSPERFAPSKDSSFISELSQDGASSSVPVSPKPTTPSKGSSSSPEISQDGNKGNQIKQARDAASLSNRLSPIVGIPYDGNAGTVFVETPDTQVIKKESGPRSTVSNEGTPSSKPLPDSPNPFETPVRRKSSPDLSSGVFRLQIVNEVRPAGIHDSGRRRSDRQVRKFELEEIARVEREELARLEEVERKKELEKEIREKGLRRVPRSAAIPPLSHEAQDVVAEALKKGMQTKVALTSNGTNITRRDIGKVLPQPGTSDDASGWLNDEIITAYLQMIVEYGHSKLGQKRSEPPKYHAFNAFFYTNLQKKGYDGVKRWAKKAKIGGKDLLQTDHIFIPVNQSGNHWTMAIVSPKHKRIEYFDSLHFSSAAVYQNIRKWLKAELGAAYKAEEWSEGVEAGYEGRGCGPTQSNGSDCGVFAITTAKMVLLGIDPKAVSATDMPLQRKRIVAEILNGGFSGEYEPVVEFD